MPDFASERLWDNGLAPRHVDLLRPREGFQPYRSQLSLLVRKRSARGKRHKPQTHLLRQAKPLGVPLHLRTSTACQSWLLMTSLEGHVPEWIPEPLRVMVSDLRGSRSGVTSTPEQKSSHFLRKNLLSATHVKQYYLFHVITTTTTKRIFSAFEKFLILLGNPNAQNQNSKAGII